VLDNRLLNRTVRPKREELTRRWIKLYKEEFCDLYPSPNFIRMIKCRRKGAGYVSRMGGMRSVHKILVGKPKRKRLLGTLRRKWRRVLKWILKKVGELGWIQLAHGKDPVECSREQANESSDSIKGREFLDHLSHY
jgi:hypothetical protein